MLRKAIKNSNGHLPQINPSKSRASRGEFARRLNKSKIPFETKENITDQYSLFSKQVRLWPHLVFGGNGTCWALM